MGHELGKVKNFETWVKDTMMQESTGTPTYHVPILQENDASRWWLFHPLHVMAKASWRNESNSKVIAWFRCRLAFSLGKSAIRYVRSSCSIQDDAFREELVDFLFRAADWLTLVKGTAVRVSVLTASP